MYIGTDIEYSHILSFASLNIQAVYSSLLRILKSFHLQFMCHRKSAVLLQKNLCLYGKLHIYN